MSDIQNPNPTDTNNTVVSGEGNQAVNPTAEPVANPVGKPADEPVQEPNGDPKKSILGGEPKDDPEGDPNPEPANLDFTDLSKELNMEIDEAKNEEFKAFLIEQGVTDQAKANELVKYGVGWVQNTIQERNDARMDKDYSDSVKHYGGTADNPGERFEEAVGKAGKALQAIEKTIPTIRQALVECGADNRVEVIQLFEMLSGFVGEDNNLMTGGGATSNKVTAKDFFPNTK